MSRKTKRSSLSELMPRIDRSILRDHGDPERIDRVWARIDRDLVLDSHPADRGADEPRRWSQMAAGVAAGFAIGVGVAGWLWANDDSRAVVMAPAPVEANAPEVLAAGAAPRTYPLPGGGVITLEPGTIVDTAGDGRGGLNLRLIRGEATVTTRGRAAGVDRLAVFIGEAEVVAGAGQMRVRHDGDTAYLRMIDGSASVRSPHREKGHESLLLGPDQEVRVPVRIVTARRHDTPTAPPTGPEREDHDEPTAPSPLVEEPVVASLPPAWAAACDRSDFAGAVQALAQDGGSLGAVNDPKYLMCLASGHRELGDSQAAANVLERVVNGFGDEQRGHKTVAASELARIYERLGEHEKAKHYREASQRLSPGLLLTADALCDKIVAAHKAAKISDVLSYAARYRAQFPDGACTDTIDKILAQLHNLEPREDVYEELDEEVGGGIPHTP